ncbi:MAG: DUF2111 domain-containing protein [Euryarchaeota archaeon]|nr:DUF2111 domain-containing protein [Euryarchaeota archaeon]
MIFRFQPYSGGGPTPKFSLFHIWKVYDVLNSQGPMGRKGLAKALGIGEGSTRTILDKMIKEGSVESTKKGAVLTERGEWIFQTSGIFATSVDMSNLTLGPKDCAVLVKGMADHVNSGYEQRDEAIRSGAMGATTLILKDSCLKFPDDPYIPDQEALQPLRDIFTIEDNDVVIVGTASSYKEAEKGAVTAALVLSDATRLYWGGENTSLISSDAAAEDIKCIALAIHELLGKMPVTMRSRDNYGVRCEGGRVIDDNYTGPVLEEVLEHNIVARKVAPSGIYRGLPVIVVPIEYDKEVVAAFGVVDVTKDKILRYIFESHDD